MGIDGKMFSISESESTWNSKYHFILTEGQKHKRWTNRVCEKKAHITLISKDRFALIYRNRKRSDQNQFYIPMTLYTQWNQSHGTLFTDRFKSMSTIFQHCSDD